MGKSLGQPGERLRLYREYENYSQKQFSEILKIKQESLSKYENGHQSIPDEIKLKLFQDNINMNWLLTGEGDMFIESVSKIEPRTKPIPLNKEVFPKHIPYLENEITIDSEIAEDFKNISTSKYVLSDSDSEANKDRQKEIELITVVNEKINSSKVIQLPDVLQEFENNIIAIVEKSDSMEPTVKKSALVVCDMLGFQGDGIYFIKLNGQYMVKRVAARLNTYLISSDNKIYESFEVPIGSKEIRIGGQVRCVTNIMY